MSVDSYTTTGFDPNGTLPVPGNPLGNPKYPVGGSFIPDVIYTNNRVQGNIGGGGANWIDLDTTVYNKSLVLTYNYAHGGATIDTSLVVPYEPTILSSADQVNEFLTTVASKPTSVPWTSFNAIFSIWIGINDIGNTFYLSGDRNTFDDTLLSAEFALVQKLVCFFLAFQVSCLLTCFQIPVVCCCPSTL